MNPLDFLKYQNAYSRYQKGMIDPGDPSEGGKQILRTSRTGKQYYGPPDYTSDEQRNMAIDRDTLQLAKTIGNDLTLEEFKQLRDQVEEVHNRYKDQSAGMTNRTKQEAIWSLPEKLKRSNPTHFAPLRFKDGTPVDLDHKDPAGTEAKLKSVPFSQVEHDPRLRDAWQAAQDGHLAALMEAGEGIGGDLSSALGGVSPGPQESLTEPLKKLLQPNEPEQPWSGPPVGWYRKDQGGLQSSVKQETPAPMVQAEMLEEAAPIAQLGGSVLDKIQTGMDFAGVADPTPIVDGVNAAISLGRAVMDPKNAGRHLLNAGISAVSMFPYVGDLAKLGKYGGKAAGAAASAGTAAAGGAAHVGNQAGGQAGGIGAFIANMFGGGQGGGGGGGAGGLGGLFGGGAGGGSGAGGAGGAMSGLGSLAGMLGAAGVVITATVGGLKMLVNWLKEVDTASRKIIEDNRDLAKYNGNLAASFAKLDRDRILRDVEASSEMAGPLGRLTRAQSRYEETQEGFTRPYKQLSADIQALKTEAVNATLKVVEVLVPINQLLKLMYDIGKDSTEARSAAQALARNAEARAKQRRL